MVVRPLRALVACLQDPAVIRQNVVFYDANYLTGKWSRFLKVLSVTKEAYGYQTSLVLQK